MKEHRKALAAMIIGHKSPMEGSAAEEAHESAHEEAMEDENNEAVHDEGKKHAAKEMVDAFHAKDHHALKTALENFIDMHK